MPVKFLSDSDLVWLRNFVRRAKQALTGSNQADQSTGLDLANGLPTQTPDVYIGFPSGEITALTEADEGTPSAPASPGVGYADIYHIVFNERNVPQLTEVSDVSRKVYNLSSQAITSDWFIVERTAYGNWLALKPSYDPCLCTDCETEEGPLDSSDCSVLYSHRNAFTIYQFSINSLACCPDANVNTTLLYNSGCVWDSTLFNCPRVWYRPSVGTGSGTSGYVADSEDYETQWILSLSPVTLVVYPPLTTEYWVTLELDIGYSRNIRYHKRVSEWHVLCRNEMELDLSEGPPLCSSLPRTVCVQPVAESGTGSGSE